MISTDPTDYGTRALRALASAKSAIAGAAAL